MGRGDGEKQKRHISMKLIEANKKEREKYEKKTCGK